MSKNDINPSEMPEIYESRIAVQAERLYESYRDKIDEVVPIFNSRHIRKFSRFDAYALGKMLIHQGIFPWF